VQGVGSAVAAGCGALVETSLEMVGEFDAVPVDAGFDTVAVASEGEVPDEVDVGGSELHAVTSAALATTVAAILANIQER